ncbi:uncharacterized protein LOC131594214 [Vicia villosa]|uniref:uncharacterized protein LOC131594214 n=1 Tax=Vicia villosa TaxID=3911 RepID=UPI00273AB0F7|nr:uncharacterized protein LOC131594214 [Vicia villosa]
MFRANMSSMVARKIYYNYFSKLLYALIDGRYRLSMMIMHLLMIYLCIELVCFSSCFTETSLYVFQFATNNFFGMLVGRLIVGIGLGLGPVVAALYVTEVCKCLPLFHWQG